MKIKDILNPKHKPRYLGNHHLLEDVIGVGSYALEHVGGLLQN